MRRLAASSADDAGKDAVVAAGAIPAALELLNSNPNDDRYVCDQEHTIELLSALAADSPCRQQAIAEAGGIVVLLRSLQDYFRAGRDMDYPLW